MIHDHQNIKFLYILLCTKLSLVQEKFEQGKQCTYEVTLRHVLVTIVVCGKAKHMLSVCL
jgi:hypothetical protein